MFGDEIPEAVAMILGMFCVLKTVIKCNKISQFELGTIIA